MTFLDKIYWDFLLKQTLRRYKTSKHKFYMYMYTPKACIYGRLHYVIKKCNLKK